MSSNTCLRLGCTAKCCAVQVREFEQLMAHMQPVFKPLLKPHLEDLEKKVAPGLFILTWASMNVDGYLHRFKQVRAHVHTLHAARLLPHFARVRIDKRNPSHTDCSPAAGARPPGGAGAQAHGHCGQQGAGQPGRGQRDAAGGPAS